MDTRNFEGENFTIEEKEDTKLQVIFDYLMHYYFLIKLILESCIIKT